MKTLKLLLPVLILLALAGCRSQKQVTPEQPVEPVEEPTWTNVTMPVRVTIAEPLKFSLNGTATMVYGQYVLVSFRTFGFEVATVCLTPDNLDMVMKLPQKAWIHEPVGDRLKSRGLKFTALQEAMLGNREVFSRLPKSVDVTVGGTENAPEVTLKTTLKGRKLETSIAWDLNAAKWNQENPARFTTPGSGYSPMSLESAMKILAN